MRPVPSRIARKPPFLIIGVAVLGVEGLNCILDIHAHIYQYMILLITCVFAKVFIVPIALVIQDLSIRILFWNFFKT